MFIRLPSGTILNTNTITYIEKLITENYYIQQTDGESFELEASDVEALLPYLKVVDA